MCCIGGGYANVAPTTTTRDAQTNNCVLMKLLSLPLDALLGIMLAKVSQDLFRKVNFGRNLINDLHHCTD